MIRAYTAVLFLLLAVCAVPCQAQDGRLKKIAATNTITIAYRADAVPYSFTDDKKQPDGFSIDLCKRVVALIGQRIGAKAPLQVKWHLVTSLTRFDAVAKGEADMECGASTVTLERLKQVDFSSFIFVESTGVLTKTSLNIRTLPDLAGKRIAVIGGTTNESAIQMQLNENRINATVLSFKTRDEAFAAMDEGKADAFASDKLLLIGAARRAKDPQALTLLPYDFSIEPYGIVLPRGDSDFRLAVNAALARIYRSGEIKQIFGQWFGSLGEPTDVVKIMYLLGAIPE
jgi:ABC-type amino acid transport substrate-binding protein